jgi:hypothetical protein
MLEKPERSKSIITLNNLFLAAKGRTLPASSNPLFNQEATSVLRRALDLLPQFSDLLLTATAFVPSIDSAAGSVNSSNPLDNESSPLAFINSLPDIDSDEEYLPSHALVDPRVQTICRIAKKLVRILHALNVPCVLFGSLASWLYGNTRPPEVRSLPSILTPLSDTQPPLRTSTCSHSRLQNFPEKN